MSRARGWIQKLMADSIHHFAYLRINKAHKNRKQLQGAVLLYISLL